MRPGISLVTSAALLLGGTTLGAVTIVDNKGSKVELTSLATSSVDFDSQGVNWHIPVSSVVSLRRVETGEMLLTTTTGEELKGQPDRSQKIEGGWELGRYSASLSDLKSVEFTQPAAPPRKLPRAKAEEKSTGFVCTFTTVSGAVVQGQDVAFNFRYYGSDTMWIPPKSYPVDDNPRYFLPMESRQCVLGVPFADILSAVFANGGAVSVKLTEQKTLEGKLAAYGSSNQRFTGRTAFGTFAIPCNQTKQIQFEHEKATARARHSLETDSGEMKSPFQLVLTTWDGAELTLANGCFVNLERGYRWDKSTSLELRLGESSNTVSFDRVSAMQFKKKGETNCELTTVAGKKFDVMLVAGYSSWFGGRLDLYGPVRIRVSDVASVRFGSTPESPATPSTKSVNN